jgi:uracil-DNA glycosylase
MPRNWPGRWYLRFRTAVPGLFNPWADVCGEDLGSNGPDAKQRRLQQHLDCDVEFILCGEAAGWQGMRHTGLAFTSERHVLDGAVPRLVDAPGRLTSRSRPFAEPSATLVWRSLYALDIAERVVMWNALPMHPHDRGDPRSNRTPTDAELTHGRTPLRLLLAAFPRAAVVAVGKKAAEQLVRLGVAPAAASGIRPTVARGHSRKAWRPASRRGGGVERARQPHGGRLCRRPVLAAPRTGERPSAPPAAARDAGSPVPQPALQGVARCRALAHRELRIRRLG